MDVFLVQPRGFCAGVRHALDIVSTALKQHGAPIYIHHEIVHNKHIIEDLKKQGIIFIDHLEEIKDYSRPLIFSAHGVSKAVYEQAKNMNLRIIDATCPLVNAVHKQIIKLENTKAEIIVIGKPSHAEILGTIGQLQNPTKAHIITTLEDAKRLNLPGDTPIGIVTQTTLSIDDTKEILNYLHKKFTHIVTPIQPNICFATTNRQKAVHQLLQRTKNIIIIGSKNSSNSAHLREAALRYGAKKAWLIDDVSDLDTAELDECETLGISAGASAPEYLVEELIAFLCQHYDNINIHDVIVAKEDIRFK